MGDIPPFLENIKANISSKVSNIIEETTLHDELLETLSENSTSKEFVPARIRELLTRKILFEIDTTFIGLSKCLKQFKDDVKSKEKENLRLSLEAERLREAISDLESERERTYSDTNSLRKTLLLYEGQIDKYKETCDSIKTNIFKLELESQDQRREFSRISAHNESLQEKLNLKKKRVKELKAANKEKNGIIESHYKEIHQLKDDLSMVKRNSSYSRSFMKAREIKQLNFVFGQVGDIKSKISNIKEAVNDGLQFKMKEVFSKKLQRELYDLILEKNTEISNISNDCFSLKKENCELKDLLDGSSSEIQNLSEIIDLQNSEIASLNDDLNRVSYREKCLSSSFSDIQEQNRQYVAKLKQTEVSLQQEIYNSNEMSKLHMEERTKLLGCIRILESDVKKLKANLASKFSFLLELIDQLKGDYESQLSFEQKRNKELQERCFSMNELIHTMRKSNIEDERFLNSKKSSVDLDIEDNISKDSRENIPNSKRSKKMVTLPLFSSARKLKSRSRASKSNSYATVKKEDLSVVDLARSNDKMKVKLNNLVNLNSFVQKFTPSVRNIL